MGIPSIILFRDATSVNITHSMIDSLVSCLLQLPADARMSHLGSAFLGLA
jgi:hypothetical protein